MLITEKFGNDQNRSYDFGQITDRSIQISPDQVIIDEIP